jgi:folate-dependent phosphoribosylglycinamide formyltransferase PurN
MIEPVPAASPRIVLLTGPFLTHTAFIHTLAARIPIAAAVRETRSVSSRRLVKRAVSRITAVGGSPSRVIEDGLAWLAGRRRARALAPPDAPAVDEYPVHNLNSDAGVALVRSLKPDILAVCGTGLLQPRVFELAPRAAVNLHLGLSPRYRGSHCVFWPLYNGEPEWVGITVHRVDSEIDAGPILAQRRPGIDRADDVESLVDKCLRLGYGAMADVIERLSKEDAPGIAQQLPAGRNYKASELTPARRAELESRLAAGYLPRYLDAHGGRVPDVDLINA